MTKRTARWLILAEHDGALKEEEVRLKAVTRLQGIYSHHETHSCKCRDLNTRAFICCFKCCSLKFKFQRFDKTHPEVCVCVFPASVSFTAIDRNSRFFFFTLNDLTAHLTSALRKTFNRLQFYERTVKMEYYVSRRDGGEAGDAT